MKLVYNYNLRKRENHSLQRLHGEKDRSLDVIKDIHENIGATIFVCVFLFFSSNLRVSSCELTFPLCLSWPPSNVGVSSYELSKRLSQQSHYCIPWCFQSMATTCTLEWYSFSFTYTPPTHAILATFEVNGRYNRSAYFIITCRWESHLYFLIPSSAPN